MTGRTETPTNARTVNAMHRAPGDWVRIEGLRRANKALRLDIGVSRGKRGRILRRYSLECRGVRETLVTDLDGGGLRLYGSSHPAARQFTDPPTVLRCDQEELRKGMDSLFRAHVRAVDDWIPFDRYVQLSKLKADGYGDVVVRGPRFLVKAYHDELRKGGIRAQLRVLRVKTRSTGRLGVLHFGDSHVVAADFFLAQDR